MESGFKFELYDEIYENCFIHCSKYANGNLQLSLFGNNPKTKQTEHFKDITLNQSDKELNSNEIVVDCLYNPTFIPQLIKLGILQEQVGICIVNLNIYPIYTIDFNSIYENEYHIQELVCA